ncbi:MAG: single-stranded DNA-binding protein [Verrucomicrobia bacterium]|nr:MAG: single-stranded DNA-binding protein [Verrucomicrobiota bacterium]
MSSFNKVLLLGRLTRDPELRVTPNGLNICKFSLAISRKYKANDGSMKEEVTFVDIDAFGKQGEVVAKFFSKGKPIFVEGRLKLNEWDGQGGEKRSKLTVVLENFQFIGSKEDASEYSDAPGYESVSPAMRSTSAVGANSHSATSEDNFDDDVPF